MGRVIELVIICGTIITVAGMIIGAVRGRDDEK